MWFLIFTLAITSTFSIYTNKQAYECFYDKAMTHCDAKVQACIDSEECNKELSKYQQCGFGEEEEVIFNGYCFRAWNRAAQATKPLVQCLIQACDLEYNSDIGVQELFKCTEKQIFKNYKKCDEECLTELNKIQGQFNTKKISQVFDVQIGNEAAKHIVSLIRQNCIEKYRQNTVAEEDL